MSAYSKLFFRLPAILFSVLLTGRGFAAPPDPLPSWNPGKAKDAIVSFVHAVTAEGAPTFVPPEDRIAVFDNDGCLWSEQPAYFRCCLRSTGSRRWPRNIRNGRPSSRSSRRWKAT